MTTKKETRGGYREGSGRPRLKKSEKKEKTKVMRIPVSKVKEVKDLIKPKNKFYEESNSIIRPKKKIVV